VRGLVLDEEVKTGAERRCEYESMLCRAPATMEMVAGAEVGLSNGAQNGLAGHPGSAGGAVSGEAGAMGALEQSSWAEGQRAGLRAAFVVRRGKRGGVRRGKGGFRR
jgi:hypothetical protein